MNLQNEIDSIRRILNEQANELDDCPRRTKKMAESIKEIRRAEKRLVIIQRQMEKVGVVLAGGFLEREGLK